MREYTTSICLSEDIKPPLQLLKAGLATSHDTSSQPSVFCVFSSATDSELYSAPFIQPSFLDYEG